MSFVFLVSLSALLHVADAGTSSEALRARALELYAAQNYAEACPLMKLIAEGQRTDSIAWSDYGLCLIRSAPQNPPEAARQALHQAWKVAGQSSALRASALFNLTLYFRSNGEGSVQLTDPRCPGQAVALTGREVTHTISRSTGLTYELTACAPGSDGGCVEDRTSRLSLGGDVESVDPLPSVDCYPENQEQRACEELREGVGLTKAEKARVLKATSCDELGALFTKRLEKIEKQCTASEEAMVRELRQEVASYPRWSVRAVDVCPGQVEVSRGKETLRFKLGEQTDAMGAEGP